MNETETLEPPLNATNLPSSPPPDAPDTSGQIRTSPDIQNAPEAKPEPAWGTPERPWLTANNPRPGKPKANYDPGPPKNPKLARPGFGWPKGKKRTPKVPQPLRAWDINRPDIIPKTRSHGERGFFIPKGMHPIAGFIAKVAAILTQTHGHRWSLKDKYHYRRAQESIRHPVCPHCAKPMEETIRDTHDGQRKSWNCVTCPNF